MWGVVCWRNTSHIDRQYGTARSMRGIGPGQDHIIEIANGNFITTVLVGIVGHNID